MYVFNGAFAGFLAGFILLLQIHIAPSSVELIVVALGLSLFILIINCAFFSIFFRYSFRNLLRTQWPGSMLIGIVTIYLAMLINSTIAQPISMFLAGSILGSFVGKFFCRKCEYSIETKTA